MIIKMLHMFVILDGRWTSVNRYADEKIALIK